MNFDSTTAVVEDIRNSYLNGSGSIAPVMSDPVNLSTFFCPTTVHLGSGATAKLPELLSNTNRVLVVVDRAMLGTAFFLNIESALQGAGIETAQFSDVEPDPSATTVGKAHALARELQPEAILAVGGGSTMDVAKAVGILMTNGGRIHDYEGIDRFSTPPLPLIAIPTTAGTGSEVSGSCVITDDAQNRKMSIRHARLNPARHAILDPQALVTLPAHVAAHAGLDAFVHALESYTSRQANLVTDAINREAIRLLSHNLRAFVADRGNLDAGLKMLTGSALTGMVFGQTGLGNVHCMARFIGAALHLSHGLSNALCLPVVARFNQVAAQHKYAEVARLMGVAQAQDNDVDSAMATADAIKALCLDVGIPDKLRDVGANRDQFPGMARDCLNAGYNRWNPRETSEADFLSLFEAAY